MSENQPPKKQQRKHKPEKVHLNWRKKWELIVNGIDKKEVPVTVLEKISVNLIDGSQVNVDIKRLIKDGEHPDDIERMLNEKFHELDDYIENVDFFVDVETVQKTIQPETDRVLKKL
jgi:hypothetical protein